MIHSFIHTLALDNISYVHRLTIQEQQRILQFHSIYSDFSVSVPSIYNEEQVCINLFHMYTYVHNAQSQSIQNK